MQQAFIEDPNSTHDTVTFEILREENSVPSMTGDYRRINVAAIAPYLFEAKYPKSSKLTSPFAEIAGQALVMEGIANEDAIKLIEGSKSFYETTPDIITQAEEDKNDVDKIYKAFEIDFEHIVEQTASALQEELNSLPLPNGIKAMAVKAINNVSIEYTYNTKQGSGASLNGELVIFNKVTPINKALHIAHLLSDGKVTADLIKTFVVQTCAHEFGHIIDSSLFPGITDDSLTASSTVPQEAYYPVEFSDSQVSTNRRTQFRERFAMYFENAVIERMGYSQDAAEDFRRAYLSMSMLFFTKVTPKRLTELADYAKETLKADNTTRQRIEGLADYVLSGHSIAQAFPFTKEQVCFGLVQVYTPSNRLEYENLLLRKREARMKEQNKNNVLT